MQDGLVSGMSAANHNNFDWVLGDDDSFPDELPLMVHPKSGAVITQRYRARIDDDNIIKDFVIGVLGI